MKTTKTNALAVLSVVALFGFTIASSASSRHRATLEWHNVAAGPKDNAPMADANLTGSR